MLTKWLEMVLLVVTLSSRVPSRRLIDNDIECVGVLSCLDVVFVANNKLLYDVLCCDIQSLLY